MVGGRVGHHVGHKERRHSTKPFVEQDAVGVLGLHQTATYAGTKHDSNILSVTLVYGQSRILHRHPGCGDGELAEAAHTPGFPAIHVVSGLEALHLSHDLGRVRRRVELRDPDDARPSLHQSLPGLLDTETQWGNGTHAGDHHSSPIPCCHVYPLPCLMPGTVRQNCK